MFLLPRRETIYTDLSSCPLENGCQTCHQAHGGPYPLLLSEEKDVLCQNCHSLSDQSFRLSHDNYPVTTGCNDCHDVHSSESEFLLKRSVHQPVSEQSCRACHAAFDAEQPFALPDFGVERCYECHDDLQKALLLMVHMVPLKMVTVFSVIRYMPVPRRGYSRVMHNNSALNAIHSPRLALM